MVEETVPATRNFPEQLLTTEEGEAALVDVMREIISSCLSIKALATSAVVRFQPSAESGALLDGVQALASRVGALADRVVTAVSGEPWTFEPDAWTYQDPTRRALALLERGDRTA